MRGALPLLLAVLGLSTAGLAQDESEDAPPRAAPSAPGPKSPAAAKLELAREYVKSRQYGEAIKIYKEIQALQLEAPLRVDLLFDSGSTYFTQGQAALEERVSGTDARASLDEARKLFEELLKTYPLDEKAPRAAYMIGSCHLILDQTEKALQAYQRAFDGFPKSDQRPHALLRLGVCQAALDQPKLAYQSFLRLRREFPEAKADVKKAGRYLEELQIVGKPAPALAASSWMLGVVGIDGIKTFDGQVVVVIFFATWCQHCKGNLPRLRGLMADWNAQGVVFIGVANPNDPMNTEPVDVYVQHHRLDYLDVALDKTGASWDSYHVDALPAAAVIDRKGKVRWRGNLSFLPPSLLERLFQEK